MTTQDFSALREQNRISIWWGISSVDGVTPEPIAINSANGKMKFEIGTSTMPVMANLTGSLPRDGNRIPCLGGASNANPATIIPVSVNPVTGAVQAETM